jgi:predicted transposase YbfD/YdcC
MLDAVTAVEKPFEIEVCQSEEQINKEELIVLKGGFSTSDHSYKFEIKSDGTGEIFYSDFEGDSEEFAHEVKVEELAANIEKAINEQITLQREENALEDGEAENIREEISGEMLAEVFWEEINSTLEDPFFGSVYDDGDWGEEFQTGRGTVDELLEFLKLCALTEREISSPDDFLVVEAETEIDHACLSECSYYTERLGELVEIACEYYKPSGFRYDYNDGCYDRQSGYCLSSESISVSLLDAARAPVREKMLAMIRLREKLIQMEIEEEKIKRLTAF